MKSINVIKKMEEEKEIINLMEKNVSKEKYNKKVYQFFDTYIEPILKKEFDGMGEVELNYLKSKCILLVNEMFLDFPSRETDEDYSKLKQEIDNLKNKKEIAEILIDFTLYQISKNVSNYAKENELLMEELLQSESNTEDNDN